VSKQMEAGKEKRHCLLLVQDVVTRWNSMFVVLQPVIRALLLDHDWQKKLDVRLTTADWTLMEKVVKALEVFYGATLKLSSSSACISDVIPIITGLLLLYKLSPGGNREDQGVKDCKRKLRASLTDRLGEKELLEQFSVATLLDPR
jgi:hypothetical protein